MTYVPKRGDSFLIDSGPQGKHLYVLLNDDAGGENLLASVTTIRTGAKSTDLTCLIQAGEHPRIHHPSFIYYRDILRCQTTHFLRCVHSGLYDQKEPVSAVLLARICAGVSVSAQTPRGTKKLWASLSP